MEIREKEFLNYFIAYIREKNSVTYENLSNVCSSATLVGILNNISYPSDSIYEDLLSYFNYDFSYEEYFFSEEFQSTCNSLYNAILYFKEKEVENIFESIQKHILHYDKYVIEHIYHSIFSPINEYYIKCNSNISFDSLEVAMHFKPILPEKLQIIINQLLFISYSRSFTVSDKEKEEFIQKHKIFDNDDSLLYRNRIQNAVSARQYIVAARLVDQYELYYKQAGNSTRKIDLFNMKLLISQKADQGLLHMLLNEIPDMEELVKTQLSSRSQNAFYYQVAVSYYSLEEYEKAYYYFTKVILTCTYLQLESVIICNYIAYLLNEPSYLVDYKVDEGNEKTMFEKIFVLLNLWLSEFKNGTPVDYVAIKKYILDNKKSLYANGEGIHLEIYATIVKDTSKKTRYYKLLELINN